MSDYTKTITNSVRVFGGASTDKWNSMTWGTNYWAFGDLNVVLGVGKVISESISLSDSLAKSPTKVIAVSVSVAGDMSSETKQDSAGYYFVFGTGTNAENRPMTSYNQVSDNTTSFTSLADTSTSWSQV
jgi:hypothetical protein